MTLIDADERARALTDLESNLLVEAAAGTGKTAILAGRVAMLLAAGRDPASIAAVTFTELAAGELALRIRQMVEGLCRGEIPKVLEAALPAGLSPDQRAALDAAAGRLDDLTATTIHGFCQGMIRAYAVEADVDPGAAVLDAPQADALFEVRFTRWFMKQLSGADTPDDPVAVLSKDDPHTVVRTLRELANLRRGHAGAGPPALDLSRRPDIEFLEAVGDFRRWYAGCGVDEPKTAQLLEKLGTLAASYENLFSDARSYADLLQLTRPPRQTFMLSRSLRWEAYRGVTAWRRASPGEGQRLAAEAANHYDACQAAFQSLLGHLGDRLVSGLSVAMDALLVGYADDKRAAAALDFDDLLVRAGTLLREHEEVRRALSDRYRHLLVDEFQDTDPLQAEIIFSLAAAVRPTDWREAQLRPGALFLVGDPKQAIYRFRGAHVAAYAAVRDLFGREAQRVVRLRANFRSVPGIIEHVNLHFEAVLTRTGQPGYVALSSTVEAHEGPESVMRLPIPEAGSADGQRDEEASAVADLCRRLVGAILVRRDDGTTTPLKPGDIALLAPTKRDLWRYERALEQKGLSVASQAGEALMLRQETQDVLALLRTLSDPLDTLAFGALMRGPLIGLTEAQLLDIAAALPFRDAGRPGEFSLLTRADQVSDPIARATLETLHSLRRHAAGVTPMALLAEAIERLHLRVVLALRSRDRNARSLANLDALLEMARPYAVRGLTAFVADLQALWEERTGRTEGRSDESEDAVSIVTMHSAKGLEWPVVIPINTSTQLRGPDRFLYRQSDETLHWVVGDVLPSDLEDAQAEEAAGAASERERLWYVACTRARDLLVLPHMPQLRGVTWAGIVNLGHANLPEFDLAQLPVLPLATAARDENSQTAEVFAQEAEVVAAASAPVTWRRPSDHDGDRIVSVDTADPASDGAEASEPAGAGRVRGILLHKLLEEVISEQLAEADIEARSGVLRSQLGQLEGLKESELPDARECAATVLRTLALSEIAEMRPTLVAEVPVYGQLDGALVSGRLDAAAIEEGRISVVLDWKSDVAPSPDERARHASQVADYLRLTGAARGCVVYLSSAELDWCRLGSSVV